MGPCDDVRVAVAIVRRRNDFNAKSAGFKNHSSKIPADPPTASIPASPSRELLSPTFPPLSPLLFSFFPYPLFLLLLISFFLLFPLYLSLLFPLLPSFFSLLRAFSLVSTRRFRLGPPPKKSHYRHSFGGGRHPARGHPRTIRHHATERFVE